MYDAKSHAASPRAPRYAAWALVVMVLGWLLAIATGLCTGAMVISGLQDNTGYSSAIVMGGLILGGIPCLIGIAMILAARKWGRRKPAPPADPNVFT